MSDLPQVYDVEPLVPIGDDEIVYRTKMPHWTMTEALFFLSGHKPPGYESARHMQDHFWNTYDQAVRAIEMGEICRKIERAGKRVFIDSPANWLAWADSLGPKHIEIDERVRRALSKSDNTHSGMAGRPTPKHLYMQEMRRRADAGQLRNSLAQEARDLRDWLEQEHPNLNPGTTGTIENAIRDDYRRLKSES